MSTKIFNGYRLRPMSLEELRRFFADFRAKVKRERERLYTHAMAAISGEIISYIQVGEVGKIARAFDLSSFDKFWWRKGFWCPIGLARFVFERRAGDIEDTGLRNPYFDLNCEVTVIPESNRKLLALLYTERKELTKIWESMPGVREYGYWNNTDKPESVTEKEWRQRGRVWERATGLSAPCTVGFTFSCQGKHEWPHPSTADVLPHIPTVKNRVERMAYEIELGRRVGKLGPACDMGKWVRTAEGRRVLRARVRRLRKMLRPITVDTLRSPIRKLVKEARLRRRG